MNSYQILIVEDEAIIALELKLILEANGFKTLKIATSGEEAIELAEEYFPDLILMDIRIKGELDGVKAALKIKQSRDIPVIFITGNTDLISEHQIKQTRPVAIIGKPVAEWELLDAINSAIESRKKTKV